jgi:protein SCO1/2
MKENVRSVGLWIAACGVWTSGRGLPTGLALALLCTSCSQDSHDQTSASAATNAHTYRVNGVVKELPAGGKSVVIRHEAIPNYMAAMTMEFKVRDTNQLRGLAPGDRVSFRMFVTEDEGWIEDLARTGTDGPAGTRDSAPPPQVYVPPLSVGEEMPDFALTNELRKAITFSQFRGQALALTFFFTRCPFPEYCPRMSRQFEATARQLASLTNGPANWRLISISFDPENDTPEVLKRYAQLYHYDPAHWSFVSGSSADITKLARLCDLTIQREGVSFTHNLRTVVLDTHGRLRTVLIGNEWSAEELAGQLTAAASAAEAERSK